MNRMELKINKELIQKKASELFPELVSTRRYLHQHPELSTEEFQTAGYICNQLDRMGISYQNGIAGTGVVGLITGKDPDNRCIAIRADMDALPIHEKNRVEYCSVNDGKMHACGHDVHMTCLLGAASILHELRDHFPGSVKLLFQPSEESYPGGAVVMIREKVLCNPTVDVVIAQHVLPSLEAGYVGFNPGADMASTDEIYLTVKGKGGHAASPDLIIDPVLISAHILLALQQIVSRNASPVMPTVLSFGKIIGNGRTNIIPDEVKLEGTVRTFNESWRSEIHEKIETMATAIASGMGGSCTVKIAHGYPCLHNHESLTNQLKSYAEEYLGVSHVVNLERRMTAEDFAYFAREVPSSLFRLGVKNEANGITSNLHSAYFDVDETSLVTGTGLLAWLAIQLLGNN